METGPIKNFDDFMDRMEEHEKREGSNSVLIDGLACCPFCGSDDLAQFQHGASRATASWYIRCRNCNARGHEDEDLSEAWRMWNMRAD